MKLTLVAPILALSAPFIAACASPMSSLQQGIAFYRDGRYEPAVRAFDEAVRQQPGEPAAWNDRGLARARLGQLVGALGDVTEAIKLAPEDAELYFNRANVYVALGNLDYAVQDYTQAIRLAPHYAKAYFNRGTARLRAGDRTGADADWRYAIAIEPDPWTQAAMVRSAGLGAPQVRAAVAAIPGTLPSPPSVPPPPPPPPSALPAFHEAGPTNAAADARALVLRGISRNLDGDRTGALEDLRAAREREPDPTRQAAIERLLRALEAPQ